MWNAKKASQSQTKKWLSKHQKQTTRLTTVLELLAAPEVALDLRNADPLSDLDAEDLSDEGEREVLDPVERGPRVLVVLPRQEGGLLDHGPAPWQLC